MYDISVEACFAFFWCVGRLDECCCCGPRQLLQLWTVNRVGLRSERIDKRTESRTMPRTARRKSMLQTRSFSSCHRSLQMLAGSLRGKLLRLTHFRRQRSKHRAVCRVATTTRSRRQRTNIEWRTTVPPGPGRTGLALYWALRHPLRATRLH